MSLFGAMNSGVSGLAAQSSAMGAIADNVTNVNTIGYKNTDVQFQTLITAQVSSTKYSPGGVQSAPMKQVNLQGLLQSSTSSTDVAISGQGFFIVNEQPNPETGSLFAYTRAGSFTVDKDGYLQNTSGWYLQGWPLQAAGNNTTGFTTVTVGADTFIKAYQDEDGATISINDNIVSDDSLEPLNLNTVGGTASETTNVNLGANLPSGDDIGKDHKTNVVIFDTLGNSTNMELVFVKDRENAWGLSLEAPTGTATIELHGTESTDSTPDVFHAAGLLEFTSVPADGETIVINGITFEFDTDSTVTETTTLRQVDISATTVVEASDVTPILKTAIDASNLQETSRFVSTGTDLTITQSIMGDAISVDVSNILAVRQVAANSNNGTFTVSEVDYAYKNGARMDFDSTTVADYNNLDTVIKTGTGTAITFRMHTPAQADSTNKFIFQQGICTASSTNGIGLNDNGGSADTIVANAGTFAGWAVSDSITLANSTTSGNDGTYTITAISADYSTISVATGSLTGTDASVSSSLTVTNNTQAYDRITATTAGTFDDYAASDSVSMTSAEDTDNNVTGTLTAATGTTLTFATGTLTAGNLDDEAAKVTLQDTSTVDYVDMGSETTVEGIASQLQTAIRANSNITIPTRFTADGTSLVFEQSSIGDALTFTMDGTTADGGTGTVSAVYKDDDNTAQETASDGSSFSVVTSTYGAKVAAVSFNGDGTPSEFNVDNIDIQWSNGATDQEYTSTTDDMRISLFMGNTNVTDGLTQYAGSYQINYISQNGAQFGNFAGLSIGEDGVVTALFDNGVTRPVFMIPVATFVNPNDMESLTGNVYIETDFSGMPTVREAGEGGAGDVAGAALESSTVDLGEEFTAMIVTQRAYSAAAKIITTADEMLDELLRIK